MAAPIDDLERPCLVDLGRELRLMREEAGLSRPMLAAAAQLSARHVQYIEAGERRTRRSTLTRLISALSTEDDTDDDRERVLESLIEIAGCGLAAESRFAERQARRREKRRRRREAIEAEAVELVLKLRSRPYP